MKTKSLIILISVGCLLLSGACAGKNHIKLQEKLESMSDGELINHYNMLGLQMDDLDRSREQSLQRRQNIPGNHYPEKDLNQLGHLHVADNWGKLKKEKELTLIEMEKRGLMPP